MADIGASSLLEAARRLGAAATAAEVLDAAADEGRRIAGDAGAEAVRAALEGRSRGGTVDSAPSDPAIAALVAVASLARDTASTRELLQESNRSREVLLAGVAHDLRNPMNTFAMSAGLLREDVDRNDIDADRALKLLGRMERALTRMQSLVEDLLEASRIEARKIDFAIRSEIAADLVHQAVKAAAAAAPERSAAIAAGDVDAGAKAMCDRARTLQVLAKAVVYASKATGEGGTIRLSVAAQGATTRFDVRAYGPSGQAVAPPEEGRGGLALLMARGLVEAQRGTFRVETADALAVTFDLPAG